MNRIKVSHYRDWLKDSATRRLLALEAEWLKEHLRAFRGLHMAYIGIDEHPGFFKFSRCSHVFRLGMKWQRDAVSADAWITESQWPLPDNSIDAVVLQHSLDLSRRPHQIIREASRVLIPNGYLIVTGFNPYSVWGGLRWFHLFSTKLPWISNPVAANRIKDWLTLLDCRTENTWQGGYLWPFRLGSEQLSLRVDRVLANRYSLGGNVYTLTARKTVAGVTPIRQAMWRQPPDGFSLPVPAARQ